MSTKLYIIDFEVNTLLSFPLPTLVVHFYVVALYNLNIGDGEVHMKIQHNGVGKGAIPKKGMELLSARNLSKQCKNRCKIVANNVAACFRKG